MRRTLTRIVHRPISHHPCLQPFSNRPQYHTIAYPLLDELTQEALPNLVEVALYVNFEHPAPTHVHGRFPQRLPCTVHRSAGTKSIGDVQKVCLIKRLKHHDHRPLQYLIVQGGYPDRPQSAIPFGNLYPLYRGGVIASRFETLQQRAKTLFEILLVFLGRYIVHPRSAPLPCHFSKAVLPPFHR